MMIKKYSSFFSPFYKLVKDKFLALFKGCLIFQQYMQTEQSKFGIKLFVLGDCETGIVLDILPYTGTSFDYNIKDVHGSNGSIIKTLMAPYIGKGHILYTDSYYSNPELSCCRLHDHGVGSCGTVRKTRKHMPPVFKAHMTKRGDFNIQKCGKVMAVSGMISGGL